MVEEEKNDEILWGKEKAIRLIGFNQLDTAELSIAKKLTGYYLQKIENMLHEYDEIKVRLKIHQRSNLFIHEITSEIFAGSRIFVANSEHKNLFHALSDCFEGMIKEIEKEFKDKKFKDKERKYQLGAKIE